MAKITTGPIVAEIRGKCAAVTFSRNRGGMFARDNGVRVAPWSARQISNRADFTLFGRRWNNGLTQTQRDGWNALAATIRHTDQLRQSAQLSGQNLWVRLAWPMYEYFETNLDDPPPTLHAPLPPQWATVTADAVTPSLLLDFDRDVGTDEIFLIQTTNPVNVGVSNFGHTFCICSSIFTPGLLPYEAIADYLALHRDLEPGKKLGLIVRSMNTTNGVISGSHLTSAIIGTNAYTNLLLNPDFETGTPGNQAPNWTLAGGSPLAIATDYVQHGLQSGKTINPTPTASFNYQDVLTLTPGTYTLEGYVRAAACSGPGAGPIFIANALPSSAEMTTIYNNHPLTAYPGTSGTGIDIGTTNAAWTYCTMKFTLPALSTGIRIFCCMGAYGNRQGTGWFDNLGLYGPI